MNKGGGWSRLLTSLVVFSALSIRPLEARDIPRLLLCIHLEGAESSLLETYTPLLGQDGLKRLLSEGVLYANADYGFPLTEPQSALATLVSGCYPREHKLGWGTDYTELFRSSQRGINTSSRLSPERLSYCTVGDVLRDITQGKASVYAISATAPEALTLAATGASGAFWLDETNGMWASSAYYPALPKSFTEVNRASQSLRNTIAKQVWTPLRRVSSPLPPYYLPQRAEGNFRYSFAGAHAYREYISSPLVGDEITRFATALLQESAVKKAFAPTILNITYPLAPKRAGTTYSPYSPEALDAYLRADKAIGSLLQVAEKAFGAEHCLFVVTSAPRVAGAAKVTPPSNSLRKPLYSPAKATALINLYLSALYGKENWVERATSDAVYLNRTLIERKALSLRELQLRTAALMREMDGVADAFAVSEVTSGDNLSMRMLRAIPLTSRADVLVRLEATTYVSEGNVEHLSTPPTALSPLPCWLIIARPGGKGVRITRPIEMVALASTLAYILRIRPPTGAQGAPLKEWL